MELSAIWSLFRQKLLCRLHVALPHRVGANGDRYDGEWKDGKEHGGGIYVWANGARYEGDYMSRSGITPKSIRRNPINGNVTEILKLTYATFVIAALHVGVATQGCFGIGPAPTVLNRSDVVVSLPDAQIVTVRIEERVNLFPWRWTARPEPVGDIILRIAEYKPSRDRKYENPTHVRLPRPQYEDYQPCKHEE